MLTFEQIKELIELVNEGRLRGVEIERSGFRLKIDGESAAEGASALPVEARVEPPPREAAVAPAAPRAAAPEPEEPPGEVEDGGHVLNSPIVGTFYSAPSPDADPYVRVGDRVKKGQVLCIVEAMKLMNEIESDADGTLQAVYPKNGQPVEFGEPLFSIETG